MPASVRPLGPPRSLRPRLAALAAALVLWAAAPAAPAAMPGPGVAWQAAAADADIERAFAQARAERKPLLLYWGASWCPPCNQLKATLFNRQDFIARAQGLVAVHVDGDGPGAQKLGARFKVRGYPTLILLQPDGREITRLPGEAEPAQVLALLELGLAGGRPVPALLAEARAGRPLSANEWRSLAFYGWDVDEAQLLPAAERPGVLAQLAAACPPEQAALGMRLLLKALAESDDGKGLKPDAALRARVQRLLADPAASRAQMDVLVNQAAAIARALAPAPGADRRALAAAFDTALRRLQADATLSRGDRMSALLSRIDLARLDVVKDERRPRLPPALRDEMKREAARADREIGDPYERQAVITAAAHGLAEAGLWHDSDALLKAGLARSPAPYYLMSQLAGNARKLGRQDEALRWYGQAFDGSQGPATRLQWGAAYLGALVELAPRDAARIERLAQQLLAEAAQDPAAFHERSARALQRVGNRLADWNRGGGHDAALRRLQAQLSPTCARLDAGDAAQRGACEGLVRTLAPRS